jgi:hypothetical protein
MVGAHLWCAMILVSREPNTCRWGWSSSRWPRHCSGSGWYVYPLYGNAYVLPAREITDWVCSQLLGKCWVGADGHKRAIALAMPLMVLQSFGDMVFLRTVLLILNGNLIRLPDAYALSTQKLYFEMPKNFDQKFCVYTCVHQVSRWTNIFYDLCKKRENLTSEKPYF